MKRLVSWKVLDPHAARFHSWAERVEERHATFVFDQQEEGESLSIGFEHLPTILANRLEQVLQLRRLEESVELLTDRVQALESAKISTTFYVQSFAPEPYRVVKPIPISVQMAGDEFIATFADANINSAGDNPQEAFANVKELILDSYDRLNSLPVAKLGPGPTRQLAVLRDFIDGPPVDNQRTR